MFTFFLVSFFVGLFLMDLWGNEPIPQEVWDKIQAKKDSKL